MKVKGYVCFMVDHPSQASDEATEAVHQGDALIVYEDEKGILWYEIQGRKWVYNGEYGKVYTREQWKDAHWDKVLSSWNEEN